MWDAQDVPVCCMCVCVCVRRFGGSRGWIVKGVAMVVVMYDFGGGRGGDGGRWSVDVVAVVAVLRNVFM